jgi:hypothetical protein
MMAADMVKVPTLGSLAVVAALLAISIWASLRWPKPVASPEERPV